MDTQLSRLKLTVVQGASPSDDVLGGFDVWLKSVARALGWRRAVRLDGGVVDSDQWRFVSRMRIKSTNWKPLDAWATSMDGMES